MGPAAYCYQHKAPFSVPTIVMVPKHLQGASKKYTYTNNIAVLAQKKAILVDLYGPKK